jgi:hypothetical protein
MLSVGLDLHKRYSQVEALEENGERRSGARLINEFEQIEGFFRSLGEPCRVVLEAGWNWGLMYDWLERVENVVEVQLAHPYGVRAIAAAQVKTDRIDARMLGQLLRVGLIPQAGGAGEEMGSVLNPCTISASRRRQDPDAEEIRLRRRPDGIRRHRGDGHRPAVGGDDQDDIGSGP